MKTLAAVAALLACGTVQAESPGVTAGRILIGQTAGFTGTVAGGVKETTEGAKLYLDWVKRGFSAAGPGRGRYRGSATARSRRDAS